jgi:hypothetical protein
MHVEAHHSADQLAERIRAESRARIARRLSAVRLALLGHTANDVAEQVLLSERHVRTWVARYNGGGVEALTDRPGRGRKKPLTDEQEQRLAARLAPGLAARLAAPARRADRNRRGVRPARRGRAARPRRRVRRGPVPAGGVRPAAPPRVRTAAPPTAAPEGRPSAADAFQKGSPSASRRSKPPVPESGSRCGSRTRHGSDRRAR